MKNVLIVALGVMVAGIATVAERAQGTPAPAASRDLSGFWELSVDSYRIPPADLVPAVTAAVLADKGKADVRALRWCHTIGLPLAMLLPRPLQIRVGRREAYFVFEANATTRHVYLNRSEHITSDIFDPSTTGDSIGRWDGDTFVVDTVGFHGERGVTAIPGGGFRTGNTRLTERLRLLGDGGVLSVVSTWTDPDVFRTPHTYEVRYSRLPDDYEPRLPTPCDAYDAERIESLEKAGAVSLPSANVRR